MITFCPSQQSMFGARQCRLALHLKIAFFVFSSSFYALVDLANIKNEGYILSEIKYINSEVDFINSEVPSALSKYVK